MKTFRAWLREQEGRDDPIGDLALDTRRCRDRFPIVKAPPAEGREKILGFLWDHRACREAEDAFRERGWNGADPQRNRTRCWTDGRG